MISRFSRIRISSFCIAMLCLALLASCAEPRRVEPDNLYWPLPPETPRIKFVQSIYTEDDIGRVYDLKEKLFGKDYLDSLGRPYGVRALHDVIYVTDIAYRRVFVFNLKTKRLAVLGDEGLLAVPASAAPDAAGNVYVADPGTERIIVYAPNGKYRTAFLLPGSKPVAVAINDTAQRLYVVDREGHRVVVFGLNGKVLFEFGGRGNIDGKFNFPLDIALDGAGNVYVLDAGNFRVQSFTAAGVFRSKFGEVGDRAGMFANPKGIAVDSEGHVYVTDAAFNNFQIFDRDGKVLLAVGEYGALPGNFQLPGGIAVNESDRIYVADQLNGRVEVFQYLKSVPSGTAK